MNATAHRRLAGFVSTAAVSLAVASSARAQSGAETEAEKLFREGRSAMVANDFATGCPKFIQSQKLDPQPGTLLNLGLCEESRGHVGAAADSLRKVIEQLPATDERVTLAREHLTAVEARFARLTVTLSPSAPAGTRVTRDGTELPLTAIGQAQRVEPGEKVLVVIAPGHAERRFTVKLEERQEKALVVEPGAADGGVAVAPVDQPSRPGMGRTLGFVGVGVGVAGLLVGGITGAMALGKKSTVDDDCDVATDVCRSQDGIDAASAGRTLSTVSTIGFVVGAVGIGAGLVLILTSTSRAQTAAQARLGLRADAAPGAAGVRLFGSF